MQASVGYRQVPENCESENTGMNSGGSLESIGPRHVQSDQGWGVAITEKEDGKVPKKNTICGALPVSPLQPFFLAGIPIHPSFRKPKFRKAN